MKRSMMAVLSTGAALAMAFGGLAGNAAAQTGGAQTGVAPNAAAAHSVYYTASGQRVAGPKATSITAYAMTTGAEVDFDPNGEHLYVCDTAADGHHASAVFTTSNYSGTRIASNYHGVNTCADANLSIPESGWVNFYAARYEGNTQLNRSPSTGHVSARN